MQIVLLGVVVGGAVLAVVTTPIAALAHIVSECRGSIERLAFAVERPSTSVYAVKRPSTLHTAGYTSTTSIGVLVPSHTDAKAEIISPALQ